MFRNDFIHPSFIGIYSISFRLLSFRKMEEEVLIAARSVSQNRSRSIDRKGFSPESRVVCECFHPYAYSSWCILFAPLK